MNNEIIKNLFFQKKSSKGEKTNKSKTHDDIENKIKNDLEGNINNKNEIENNNKKDSSNSFYISNQSMDESIKNENKINDKKIDGKESNIIEKEPDRKELEARNEIEVDINDININKTYQSLNNAKLNNTNLKSEIGSSNKSNEKSKVEDNNKIVNNEFIDDQTNENVELLNQNQINLNSGLGLGMDANNQKSGIDSMNINKNEISGSSGQGITAYNANINQKNLGVFNKGQTNT